LIQEKNQKQKSRDTVPLSRKANSKKEYDKRQWVSRVEKDRKEGEAKRESTPAKREQKGEKTKDKLYE
jgi:hypothetical protein